MHPERLLRAAFTLPGCLFYALLVLLCAGLSRCTT